MTPIPVKDIVPNPDQPRTIFDQDELKGLAQSIKESGLIQPIVVEAVGEAYILIDGERRWRAHQILNLSTIEAVVRPVKKVKGSDRLMHALVANIQRSSMGFVDEANAFQKLIAEFGTVEAVSEKTGVGAATITNRLYLLDLSEVTQKFYNLKKLPFDLSIITLFKKLKHDEQDRLASLAVTRGWKTTSILRAAQHVLNNTGRKNKEPVLRQAKEVVVEGGGHFDALALAKQKFTANIKVASRSTCKSCALYEDASPKVCGQCPLPDFLNRLQS